jgi:hypothetical protein
MKLGKYWVAILFSPVLMQGLCNKEDVQSGCTEMVTWSENGKDGFYQSTAHDSHFRELYFKTEDGPSDICPEVQLTASFKISPVNGIKLPNVIQIEGKVLWGDEERVTLLSYSDSTQVYSGVIENIDIKPYYDEHPGTDGSGAVDVEFKWYDLSVGTEQNDLQYILDNISDMHTDIQYVRK